MAKQKPPVRLRTLKPPKNGSDRTFTLPGVKTLGLFAAFFLTCSIVGYFSSIKERSSLDFIVSDVSKRMRVSIEGKDIKLYLSCNGRDAYRYDLATGTLAGSPMADLQIKYNDLPTLGSVLPISREFALSFAGGASGGFTLKALIEVFKGDGEAVSRSWRALEVGAAVVGAASGYAAGVYVASFQDPSCDAGTLEKYLGNVDYWDRIKKGVLLYVFAQTTACENKYNELKDQLASCINRRSRGRLYCSGPSARDPEAMGWIELGARAKNDANVIKLEDFKEAISKLSSCQGDIRGAQIWAINISRLQKIVTHVAKNYDHLPLMTQAAWHKQSGFFGQCLRSFVPTFWMGGSACPTNITGLDMGNAGCWEADEDFKNDEAAKSISLCEDVLR
jgi:hypothetical protein